MIARDQGFTPAPDALGRQLAVDAMVWAERMRQEFWRGFHRGWCVALLAVAVWRWLFSV